MRGILSLAILVFLAGLGPLSADPITLKLEDARQIARAAFLNKDFALANSIAKGLLQANPDDTHSLLLIAATSPRLGAVDEGLDAGKRAFRSTSSSALRFEAAYYVALAAATDERYTTSKYWLRRAHQLAENEKQKTVVARQYQEIRRRAPLSISLDFSIVPSTNINNGSEDTFLSIDGFFPIGVLSADARALSGFRLSSGIALSYTLKESTTRKTSIGVRANTNTYALSSSSKSAAPNARASDFNSSFVEFALTHRQVVSSPLLPDRFTFALGGTWSGGNQNYRFARLGVGRSYTLSERSSIGFDISHTILDFATNAPDSTQTSLSARFIQKTKRRNAWSVGLRYHNGRADAANSTFDAIEASATYAFAKQLGPAKIDLGLTLGQRDYSRYTIGFFNVRGGRQDNYAYGTLGVTLPSLDYFGFVPRVSLQATEISSNISRFDQNSLSIGLGLRSSF